MKKSLILFCILSVFLSGCAAESTAAGTEVIKTWKAGESEEISDRVFNLDGSDTDAEDSGISEKKIGMVTDIGGIDDESFNQSAWEGLQSLEKDTGVVTTYVESSDSSEYSGNIDKLLERDCSLCWCIGYASADAMLEKAKENPDTSFAIIDSSYGDTPSNVTGVVFRAEEPSFIVGYIAAAATKTGKIGFVGGITGEIIDQFEYGFRAGVAYASSVYGKNVDIDIEYADSFNDEEKGREIGKRMFDEGCDIVYHAAGGVGIGVIEEAVKADKFAIGVDRDQSYLAPKNVLTSAMKLVNVAVERVSKAYLKDEEIGGKTLSFGLTEGAVGIPENHDNYNDEIYDSALVIEDRIKSGEIDPPANLEEYEKFMEDFEKNE
ncbi:MAG: BMP family ABC transporter substrate-binding protein [Lachnospiraceae bacterium]|nr:BMP family ABC transporter substrate-binding protein [Lachnospiraceae bacterium]